MDDSRFTEETLASEEVFTGRLLHVHRDEVRLPDGHDSIREWVDHPGAVVVVALLDNGKLLFERQYRYPLRRVFIELPAGKIDTRIEVDGGLIQEIKIYGDFSGR